MTFQTFIIEFTTIDTATDEVLVDVDGMMGGLVVDATERSVTLRTTQERARWFMNRLRERVATPTMLWREAGGRPLALGGYVG